MSAAAPPVYVDLDGTLTYTDLLFESVLVLLKQNPLYVFLLPFWLLKGRGWLKAEVASRVSLDVTLLPYNDQLLAWLRQQHAAGRRLVLASASDAGLVRQVADHIGLFDHVLGSDRTRNLKSSAKLQAILLDAGDTGFAYAGNGAADLAIWARAQEVIVVNASNVVAAKAGALPAHSLSIAARRVGLRQVAKALRLHQWAKNLLLFLPLVAAHELAPERWLNTLLGFVAFGLCASATYVINDLLDLAADRMHPRKRYRPFAAATLGIPFGIALAAVLLPVALWLAALCSPLFAGLLLLYIVITLAYSARLKRLEIVDVLVLSMLYTHRVIAGGVASGVVVSNWLLAVSLFMFLSLALVKRCTELEFITEAGKVSAAGRGYRDTDLPYLIAMGIASAFVGVMVLALYIDSQEGGAMYPLAQALWLLLPLVLYWVMRLWIKVSRREIHDDPLLFAITDPASWAVAWFIACIVAVATLGGYA